jgi:hypothetical protein
MAFTSYKRETSSAARTVALSVTTHSRSLMPPRRLRPALRGGLSRGERRRSRCLVFAMSAFSSRLFGGRAAMEAATSQIQTSGDLVVEDAICAWPEPVCSMYSNRQPLWPSQPITCRYLPALAPIAFIGSGAFAIRASAIKASLAILALINGFRTKRERVAAIPHNTAET